MINADFIICNNYLIYKNFFTTNKFILFCLTPFVMEWLTVGRPGFSGRDRDKRHAGYNEEYGEGNWRIMWVWNNQIIPKYFAYQLYEDGYYADSFNREDVWQELLRTARNVYDIEPRDVESGLDYLVQKGTATHLQDISIRRVVQRRGWSFQGKKLVQVRKHGTYWGNLFSPGRVMFHLPQLIEVPHLEGWWAYNSIEDFYQSNKILQVKEGIQHKYQSLQK
jgi:hypothetical protein